MTDIASTGCTRARMRAGVRLAAVALLLSLAGCSGGSGGPLIGFEGKIFDLAGMSGSGEPKSEPRIAERAPLVPPPRTDQLPAPGAVAAADQHMAWPDDPDARRRAIRAAEAQKKKAMCDELKTMNRPEHERAAIAKECQQASILTGMTNWFKKEKPDTSDAAYEADPGRPLSTGSTRPAPAAAGQAPRQQ